MAKNVNLQHSSVYLTDREKIWAAVRQLRQNFTRAQVSKASGVWTSATKDYIQCLVNGGYLSVTTPQIFTASVYTLLRDCGASAPRLGRDGSEIQPTGRTRMWQAMPILRTFTPEELVNTASLPSAPIALADAEFYCRWLVRGGYLRKGGDTYTAIPSKRHGPKAPQVLRVKQLFDPNTGEVVAEKLTHREEAE